MTVDFSLFYTIMDGGGVYLPMNRVVGDEMPGCRRQFHILGKTIIKIEPSRLTGHLNHCSIFYPLNYRVVKRLGGVVGCEFDGAPPGEVKEVKIFCIWRVGDGNANCAKLTDRQRPPDV